MWACQYKPLLYSKYEGSCTNHCCILHEVLKEPLLILQRGPCTFAAFCKGFWTIHCCILQGSWTIHCCILQGPCTNRCSPRRVHSRWRTCSGKFCWGKHLPCPEQAKNLRVKNLAAAIDWLNAGGIPIIYIEAIIKCVSYCRRVYYFHKFFFSVAIWNIKKCKWLRK